MADRFEVGSGADNGYQAASFGRRLARFRPPNYGPNQFTRGSYATIRARSRSLARNDSWAGTASDKLVYNMVGTGIQARSKNGTVPQKTAIKKVWDSWCRVADADSVLDFYGLQALVVREWDEVGECFGRIRQRYTSDGLPVPMQVQLLESEMCPADYYAIAANGNQIRAGIEFNAINTRVAYWFYQSHPFDYDARANLQLVRVPAEEVLHVYEPRRIGQLRGLPRSTSVLLKYWNLDNLTDAAIERTKIANLFAMFFEQDGNAPSSAPLVPDSVPIDDEPTYSNARDVAQGIADVSLEPGGGLELPPGKKVVFSNPPTPGQDFAALTKLQLLAIAARHGVPYEVLTGDLGAVSDRALRLILNEFRRFLEQQQWLYLIPQFCQPIRAAFFDAGVLSGALEAPEYATKRDDFIDTLWLPQGWPYSHPVQDVTADKAAVRAGFTSKTAIIYANGDDPEEVRAQRLADNEAADEDGDKTDSDPRYTSDVGRTQATPAGTGFPADDEPPAAEATPEPAPNSAPAKPAKPAKTPAHQQGQ